MRLNNLTLVMVGILLSVAGLFITAQSQPFEMIEIGTGADPHWSPDGTKLAYVYKGGLYITNADGTGEPQKIADLPPWTHGFNWLDSTEFVFWGKEYKRIGGKGEQYTEFRIKTLTLKGREKFIAEAVDGPEEVRTATRITAPIILTDRTVGYYEFPFEDVFVNKSESKVFKIVKQGKFSPDTTLKQTRAFAIPKPGSNLISGDIWLESLDGSVRRRITTGQLHSFPDLSPDGTKILTSCKGCGSMCIMDLEGNETCVGEKGVWPTKDGIDESCMGPPFAKWSLDSKKIAYAYVKSKILDQDGQMIQTIGSEIHIVNVETSEDLQITNTPDIHEGNPVWSPDGTRIACVDGATSKIYVIKVE